MRPQASSLNYLCSFNGIADNLIYAHPSVMNVTSGGYYMTPLYTSLMRWYKEITSPLLGKGVNADGRDIDGATLLHRTCLVCNVTWAS